MLLLFNSTTLKKVLQWPMNPDNDRTGNFAQEKNWKKCSRERRKEESEGGRGGEQRMTFNVLSWMSMATCWVVLFPGGFAFKQKEKKKKRRTGRELGDLQGGKQREVSDPDPYSHPHLDPHPHPWSQDPSSDPDLHLTDQRDECINLKRSARIKVNIIIVILDTPLPQKTVDDKRNRIIYLGNDYGYYGAGYKGDRTKGGRGTNTVVFWLKQILKNKTQKGVGLRQEVGIPKRADVGH